MKIRLVLLTLIAMFALSSMAQYIPSVPMEQRVKNSSGDYWHWGNTFKHLDLALSLGTSGIGIEVASPICEFAQVRIGYEMMPHFRKKLTSGLMIGNEKPYKYDKSGYRVESNYTIVREMMYQKTGYDMKDHIDMTGKLTMQNFKFLVDIFPLSGNKNLHVTLGVYWGPSEYAKIESDHDFSGTLACVNAYNKLYAAAEEGDVIKSYGTAGYLMGQFTSDMKLADGTAVKSGDNYKMTGGSEGKILIPAETNSIKPYVGIGYEGVLLKKHRDIKFAVTGGLMFWGGAPSLYTADGVNLVKDVKGIEGKAGNYVSLMSKLKAYPTIGVRIIKNIF
jgi:hypothetical protein